MSFKPHDVLPVFHHMKNISRRILFAFAVALTALHLPLRAVAETPPEKPNIVFILADDLGRGDVGCYGQTKIQTPNIDALASEGLKFSQAYAGCPVCAPSRCALMTGLHTGHTLIRGNDKVNLRQQDRTVAEILKANGYATTCAGKWGLGLPDSAGTPCKKGFDSFYGFMDQTHAHNSWPTFLYRNEDKVELSNVVPNMGPYGQGVATVKKEFANDLFRDEIVQFIQKAPTDKPFFIYAPFTAPHANNEAHTSEVPELGAYAEKDWTEGNKAYAALVTRLDSYVGQILQAIKDRKIENNTLVIFTSDNGVHAEGRNDPKFFNSSGPLRGIKREMYEGGTREPMIAWWPGHTPAGKTTDQIFAFWDFLPTAAELAGAAIPKDIDGISIAPTLLGQAQTAQHEYLYWEFHEKGFEQSVRAGDWKAVRHAPTGPIELYDLKSDVGEAHDVATEHPEIVAKMKRDMDGSHVEPDVPGSPRAQNRRATATPAEK
jgi:arylsulfatase A-like enzyme